LIIFVRSSKVVVSGSAKRRFIQISMKYLENAFNIIINGDQFEWKGKPDPA